MKHFVLLGTPIPLRLVWHSSGATHLVRERCFQFQAVLSVRLKPCNRVRLPVSHSASVARIHSLPLCPALAHRGSARTAWQTAGQRLPRSKYGSAQECDEGCILGRFLENDDFSPSGRPNTRLRRKWAEFAALLWKWRAEGGREK